MGHVLRSDARALVVDGQMRGVGGGCDVHRDRRARRAVRDRVVGEDRHQLAEPQRIADERRRRRIEQHVHLARLGERRHRPNRLFGHLGEVDRHRLQLHDARIGPGEQQQVADERGQMLDLVADVAQRLVGVADRLVAMALEVLDARSDDRERRPELVARVGRELALAAERLADRDERPAARRSLPTTSAPSTARKPPTRSTWTSTPRIRCSPLMSWTTWTTYVSAPRCTGCVSTRTGTPSTVSVADVRVPPVARDGERRPRRAGPARPTSWRADRLLVRPDDEREGARRPPADASGRSAPATAAGAPRA